MKLKNQILTYVKHIDYKARPRQLASRFMFNDVPYFSQWESRELNKQILERVIKTEDDPKWKLSGAKTKEEYAQWSWSACGMACTKMLLAHKTGKTVPIVELGKKCAEYGGYNYPLGQSNGLIYAPYVQFMKAEFGIESKIVAPLLVIEIVAELAKGNYVIASVSPDIREPHKTPKSRGGHLVLMLGYDLQKKELYLHNPSGTSKSTQGYAAVSFADFKKFFSGRGIVVY